MSFNFAVIDAPGYSGNRANVYSRHKTLAAARKALRGHYVTIPGNGRKMSACIVERPCSASTDYVFWDGLRSAQYRVHEID